MADFENSTRTPVIKIGTTEAVKNVKDLRDNIAGLRDEIVALSNSETKNADTEKALADAEGKLIASQQELNRVMGLTKKGADGVEGSYNNLKAQLRETKAAMDAIPKIVNNSLNPAWDSLAERYKTLNAQAKAYDFELGNFQRNVGNYGNALQSIGAQMNEVKQVGGDMAAGFQAATGLLNIAGVATDGLDDSMNNLRLTLGIVQGAKGIAGMIKNLLKLTPAQKAATTATKADTVAQKAETQALNETAAAETAAAGAGTVLRTVLMSLGIGLIVAAIGLLVANLEDVTKWLVSIGEKLGIIKKQNTDGLMTAEKLKENYESQKEELDKQARILQAKGKTQKDILKFQIEQTQASLDTKKAELESAKATLERLKSHNAIQRLLKGETREYREAKKAVEELNEQIKNEEKYLADRNFDLELEGYKEATDAAKKAVQDAEAAAKAELKSLQDALNKGLQTANKVIEEQKSELDKIEGDYNQINKDINEAVEASKKLTGVTEEQRKTLTDGVLAAQEKYQKAVQAYSKKNYEKNATEYIEQQREAITAQYETQVRYEKLYKDVLGYDAERSLTLGKATAEQQKQYEVLKKTVEYLYETAKVQEPLEQFAGMTEAEIEEKVGQPLATAIKMYFDKSKELQDAGIVMAQTIYNSYNDTFQKKLESGDYKGARGILMNFLDTIKTEPTLSQISDELTDEIDKMFRQIYKAVLEDENPLAALQKMGKGAWKEAFNEIYNAPVEAAKDALEGLKAELATYEEGSEKYLEIQAKIDAQEVKLHKARMARLEAWNTQALKFLNTYGAATANVLGSVADMWEENLKAQGKTNEEAFTGVKILQGSVAVINTAAAVAAALADPTAPSWIVKAANAAAALAAGTAQILKIKNTKLGQDSTSTSAPKIVDRTPALQYTYGLNAADYAQAAAAYPVRAYVVDRDLNEGLNNYNKREGETTF